MHLPSLCGVEHTLRSTLAASWLPRVLVSLSPASLLASRLIWWNDFSDKHQISFDDRPETPLSLQWQWRQTCSIGLESVEEGSKPGQWVKMMIWIASNPSQLRFWLPIDRLAASVCICFCLIKCQSMYSSLYGDGLWFWFLILSALISM